MVRLLLLGAAVSVLSCGGGSTRAPESPDGESSAAGHEQPEPDEVAEGPSAEAADGPAEDSAESHAAESGAAASAEDVKRVLQLVVDDPELEKYLRLGEPGRFPLKISGSDLPAGLELTKGTKPVEIVGAPDGKAPVLVFTKIDASASRATIGFRYDAESIRGTTTLEKGPYGWEIKNSRIVER